MDSIGVKDIFVERIGTLMDEHLRKIYQINTSYCNRSWKLGLSTSNDEINDLNIALERIKEFEHQVAQNVAKLDILTKCEITE